jgi:hypothetical protein
LADRAKSRIDLLKNAAATERRVTELEQELKQVREAAAVEKKLEDQLAEEKRKTKEANAQFNAFTIGKVKVYAGSLVPAASRSSCGMLILMSCRLP